MGCHVYYLSYCKTLRIGVCDMRSKDAKSQCIMCSSLLKVVKRFELMNQLISKDLWLMTQANFITLQRMFGFKNLSTCLFHRMKSIEKHTKSLNRNNFQDEHKFFCHRYKKSRTLEDFLNVYFAIKAWWFAMELHVRKTCVN
jgi:hypothetical protein